MSTQQEHVDEALFAAEWAEARGHFGLDESFQYPEEQKRECIAAMKEIVIVNVSKREFDTILAALRFWQRRGVHIACPEREVAGENGVSLVPNEIDALIERIN